MIDGWLPRGNGIQMTTGILPSVFGRTTFLGLELCEL
jgi:hypothetical protein